MLAGINRPIVSIFINDIKVMKVKRLGYIEKMKQKLAAVFKMINIKPINFYQSLKVEKNHKKRY